MLVGVEYGVVVCCGVLVVYVVVVDGDFVVWFLVVYG